MFNTLISFYIHFSIDEEVLMQHDIGTLDRNLATIKSRGFVLELQSLVDWKNNKCSTFWYRLYGDVVWESAMGYIIVDDCLRGGRWIEIAQGVWGHDFSRVGCWQHTELFWQPGAARTWLSSAAVEVKKLANSFGWSVAPQGPQKRCCWVFLTRSGPQIHGHLGTWSQKPFLSPPIDTQTSQ